MEALHVMTDITTPHGNPTWVRMMRHDGAVYAELCDISWIWRTAGREMPQKEYEFLKHLPSTIVETDYCTSYLHEGTVPIRYYFASLRDIAACFAADPQVTGWLNRLLVAFDKEEERLSRLEYADKPFLFPNEFIYAYPFVAGTHKLTYSDFLAILYEEKISASRIENNRGNRIMMRQLLARRGYAPQYPQEYHG